MNFDLYIIDLIIYVLSGLCKKWSVHRYVCIVFWPSQPVAMRWFNYPVVGHYQIAKT
jgi:hypothetical protein